MNNQSQEIFIVRCGEVALKGKNKPYFERILLNNLLESLKPYEASASWHEGLMIVEPRSDYNPSQFITRCTKVFGVVSVSPAISVDRNMDTVKESAISYLNKYMDMDKSSTFKVKTSRSDKTYPLNSPEISAEIGAAILRAYPNLSVDIKNPDFTVYVNIRRDSAYIYSRKYPGAGGLPARTNGRGLLLLSGGIDSPVAAYMMAKRGMTIDALHFHSYPYTSPRALQKVRELCQILVDYLGPINLHIINLLPVQEAIVKNCPEDQTTILVRRFMMRIAEQIAKSSHDMMLITGEDLGQVASQTAEALVVTDAVVSMPVMRPLIALDKVDIIELATKIGSYEKSIEPYEDCCTVFLPKHPVTKPRLQDIIKSEAALNVEELVSNAVNSDTIETITV